MFLLNLGYQWRGVPTEQPHGFITLASGRNREHLTRVNPPAGRDQALYFDPQSYLVSLAPADSGTTCARLATYPWFVNGTVELPAGTEPRDWEQKLRENLGELWAGALPVDPPEIEQKVRQCVEFQARLGVTAAILPVPTCADPTGSFEEQLQWIDIGCEVCRHLNLPALATICLPTVCFGQPGPQRNQLMEIIADNLTARDSLAGAYLVVDATGASAVRLQVSGAVGGLLYLCRQIGLNGHKQVLVNFVETLGFVCLAAGAAAFGTGYSNKTRRLSLEDFAERGGGRTFPKFYSHSTINDYRPASDMERLRDARLLRYLRGDVTSHSQALFETLSAGRDAASLFSWADRVNNTVAAGLHYVERMRHATDSLAAAGGNGEEAVLTWLQDAERDTEYLSHRFEGDPVGEDARHVAVWRSQFEEAMHW